MDRAHSGQPGHALEGIVGDQDVFPTKYFNKAPMLRRGAMTDCLTGLPRIAELDDLSRARLTASCSSPLLATKDGYATAPQYGVHRDRADRSRQGEVDSQRPSGGCADRDCRHIARTQGWRRGLSRPTFSPTSQRTGRCGPHDLLSASEFLSHLPRREVIQQDPHYLRHAIPSPRTPPLPPRSGRQLPSHRGH